MKIDRLLLIALVVVVFGFITKIGFDAKEVSDQTLQVAQKNDAMRRDNAVRQKQLAYAAHLKRAAFDAAHPEIVARRKAEAVEARRVAQAENDAEQAKEREAQRIAEVEAQARQARTDRENHPCATANSLANEAISGEIAGHYQATYDTSVSGLHYAALCDNSTDKVVNEGFLLSAKGYAEHELGSGDWRTDLNQANAILVQCQTMPGLYGTHAGAQCETQETYNISSETNWGMQQ